MIHIEKLNFSFGQVPVLEDIHLHVDAGEFIGIIGPNGGGKTTLIKLMLGLLKPQTGKMTIFGKKPSLAVKQIGYVPQRNRINANFPISSLEVVMMGCISRTSGLGFFGKKDRVMAEEALEKTECQHLGSRRFNELSGGERQRILIARALVGNPKLLILDEPTSNVDPGAEGNIYSLLHDLGHSATILIVSHDLGFVSTHVSRVACVNRTLSTHATEELTGKVIESTYHRKLDIVLHDHGHCTHE